MCEADAPDKDSEFRGERADVLGRLDAIAQRDGGNRQSSNSARLWAGHLQSRIKLGRLFALCGIGRPLRHLVLAVR